ncbi:response regulator transcription factor [Oleiharenicola sp. Vm1]|uniref:response regulator transcription factor n=1 Tax=Oleiharenicola sp. Vm1 TaxID=3398393 RepID=UPI0039F5A90B
MRHAEHESGGGVVKLTPAEAAVVAQVVRGLTNKEIARALRKSELTVKNQLAAVYRKLGVKRRLQLIAQFRA